MNRPVPTRGAESLPGRAAPRPPHAAVSARTRHRLAARRDPTPWLAVLVTVALITGAVLTIVLGVAPPLPAPVPPMTRTPVVAPLEEVTPAPAVTIVLGKNARAGSDCSDLAIPGIDDNGTATVCRSTPDGLRWFRR